jgi:ankyrin repeat protein
LVLGDARAIETQLAHGADPNTATPLFNGPVWLSSLLMGQKEIFYTLTRGGQASIASANTGRRAGAEALVIAGARNYPDVVEFVLLKGVDVNARLTVGTTALQVAAANGNADIVRMLIARQANVNLADQFGDTPLIAAVQAGSLPVLAALLSAGADANAADKSGRSAAWWAARSGREDILKELLAHGANVSTADHNGSSPADQAIRAGYTHMGRLLRARGGPAPPRREVHAAVEASLRMILPGVEVWSQRTGCNSCHHTLFGSQTILMARRYGMTLDSTLAERQLARFKEDLIKHQNRYATATKSRVASARADQPGLDLAYGLASATLPVLGLDDLYSGPLGSFALVLANLQFEDGRWTHGMARFPVESSDCLTTAHAIRTLSQYAPAAEKERIQLQVAKAVEWLRAETCATTDDLTGKLYGLFWANRDEREIRQAATELLREQRADGSWAQKRGMNGDAYATGVALFALYRTRQLTTKADPYRRGIQYLLRTQEEDGSWLIPTRAIPLNGYLEGGSPHGKHQFISFAGTCWATMALIADSGKPPV